MKILSDHQSMFFELSKLVKQAKSYRRSKICKITLFLLQIAKITHIYEHWLYIIMTANTIDLWLELMKCPESKYLHSVTCTASDPAYGWVTKSRVEEGALLLLFLSNSYSCYLSFSSSISSTVILQVSIQCATLNLVFHNTVYLATLAGKILVKYATLVPWRIPECINSK